MKVIFHEDFYQVYTSDPAAAAGRMEAVVDEISYRSDFVQAKPASESQIALVHEAAHIESVRHMGFFHMAALAALKNQGAIDTAHVLDFDLHFGDGTVNILGRRDYVTVQNVEAGDRGAFLDEISQAMATCQADIIGLSAGFDNHLEDWGGLLLTEDYFEIGRMVREAAERSGGGCFAILEGGYNHQVLGANVLALIDGMARK